MPGPGAYSLTQGVCLGVKTHIAQYRSISFVKWRNDAVSHPRPTTPGPGHYETRGKVTGISCLAGEKNTPAPSFPHQLRRTFSNDAITRAKQGPGPGSYDITSEFGTDGKLIRFKAAKRPKVS